MIRREAAAATLNPRTSSPTADNDEGSRIAARPFNYLVEPRGIEPLTSRVR